VTGERWPAGLEQFLAIALQREPEHRFANAEQALFEWRGVQPSAWLRRSTPPPARSPHITGLSQAIDAPATVTDAGPLWESHTEGGDGYDLPE
jgi:hypothetical protein